MSVCVASGRCLMISLVIARVSVECGILFCVGGVTSKLFGFCGWVHGAWGRLSGVALFGSFV